MGFFESSEKEQYTPFLQYVAKILYDRYGEQLSALTLVFPSRRARLYFSEYLSRLVNRPIWQPKASSIDEIFSRITGLSLTNSYTLNTEIFNSYKKFKHTDESFDHFYFWGEVMLKDFDALDKYLVQVDPLLKNLASLKNMDSSLSFLSKEQQEAIQQFWKNFAPENNKRLRENFVSLWDALLPTYNDLRQTLTQKKQAYQGMLYRQGAEILQKKGFDFGNEKFVFIGFNALNECEKVLFRHLKKEQLAEYFWDYDHYYISDLHQEAGLFMRQNLREFPPVKFDENYSPFIEKKDIQIVATPSDVLQAKLLPQLLDEVRNGQALDRNTAVVLADEGLLIPTLYSLPKEIETLNITMGYPLSQTPIYSLVELIIKLQKNARATENQPVKFYHKDALALLQHQYIQMIARDEARKLCDKIVKQNHAYITPDDLKEYSQLFNTQIFTKHSTHSELIAMLCNLMKLIAAAEASEDNLNNKLRREYVVYAYKALNQLSDALNDSEMQPGMPVFLNLLRSALQEIRIPFEGEPISGLQVMGILETRTLDFENLVILSLNDDIFPRGESAPSLIPHNLRRGFGLPTIEQHEAMYAYYFYRLLQRAKRVRLVYNSQSSDSRTGEVSRYLRQLKMETDHNVVERSVSYSVTHTPAKPIVVSKTGKVNEILTQYLDGGERALSASTISSYMACPLKFYFSQIAKLAEPEEVTEEVDGRMLGNIFHRTMQLLYHPFKEKILTKTDIENMLSSKKALSGLVEKITANEFFHNELAADEVQRNGKLYIVKETVRKYVEGTLRYDMKRAPFTILGLEEKLKHDVATYINGVSRKVNLIGFIDRIDAAGDCISIVDYKTGSGGDKKMKFQSVEALFSQKEVERRPEIFQTLLYSLIIQNKQKSATIVPELFFIRSIYSDKFSGSIQISEDKKYSVVDNVTLLLPRFEELLCAKLSELFDTTQAFVQTDEQETCMYCPYKEICHR